MTHRFQDKIDKCLNKSLIEELTLQTVELLPIKIAVPASPMQITLVLSLVAMPTIKVYKVLLHQTDKERKEQWISRLIIIEMKTSCVQC